MGLFRKQKCRADGTVSESPVWWTRFKLHGQDYRRSTGEVDKAAATRAARQIRADIESRTPAPRPAGSRLTLMDLAAQDIEAAEGRGVSDRQVESIEERWTAVLRYYGEHTPPERITYDNFSAFAAHRRASGVRGQTIRKERQALARGLRYAKRQGQIREIPDLPTLRSDPPLAKQAGKVYPIPLLMRWLDEVERDARAGTARWQAEIVLRTSLRAAEVRRLEWSWVQPLREPAGRTVANLVVPASSAKTRTERVIGLDDHTLGLIADLAAEVESGPLCPLDHRKAFRGASKRVGERSVTLRDLRHIYASLASEGSLMVARGALGHTSLAMTSRYAHSSHESVHAAASSVSAALAAAGEEGAPHRGHPTPETAHDVVGVPRFELGAPCSQSRYRHYRGEADAGSHGAEWSAEVTGRRWGDLVGGTPGGHPFLEALEALLLDGDVDGALALVRAARREVA